MNHEELTAWLRLTQTEAVGPVVARQLLGLFGLPENIFSASLAAIRQSVGESVAHALTAPPPGELQNLIERTQRWLDGSEQRHIITLADARYPPQLLSIHDPPTLLYVIGDPTILSQDSIAIVGSRNATAGGIKNVQAFASDFAQRGIVVTSGLALGVDGAAHAGALDTGGLTIAVMGTGPDIIYPSRHKNLAHRIIASGGAIATEFPVGSPALPHQFPRRNRIISGLSRGVLVAEAAIHSGSLITARMAGEQGREVFAIPGSIHSPQAKGCHKLIKDGAKLVESAEDIISELHWKYSSNTPPKHSSPPASEDPWLVAAGYEPFTVDELAERIGAHITDLSARLLDWELDGRITPLPGGRWQRCQ